MSSRITHTDPKADYGAYAIALAARMSREQATVSGASYLDELASTLGAAGDELTALVRKAVDSVADGQSATEFAAALGLSNGVTAYVYHSVPIAIHAWLGHQRDLRGAVSAVIACGGDADSTGAMVGGIVGASVGREGIPREWVDRLAEWPRSVPWMERLGEQLARSAATGKAERPIGLPIWGVLPRNAFFLLVVLFHGFRRLLPPY